jgi:peptide/nickel transport system substrate-binding protein
MFQSKKITLVFGLLMVASFVLAACQPAAAPTAETVVETVVVTEIVDGGVVEVVVTATAAPVVEEPAAPRTLVVCLGQEPDTLYINGGSMLASSQVWQAIYDGPIDNRSFDYQAIILEKLPSLADGDAVLQAVEVAPGESMVDADNNPASLEAGVVYRPSGCQDADCALTYADGDGNITVDQMVVTFKMLPGMMWSDGTPMTAADSVYHWELDADPDTPQSKFLFDRSSAYEALDDVTIQWTGLPGYIDATYFVNFYQPLPQHVWGQYTAAELLEAEEARSTPIGWGPYVIDEWVVGDSITMHRNDNYFRADEGLPKFENAVYRMVGENSNANIAKILSGECDLVDQTSHLDDQSELILELQAAGQLNATFVTGTVFEHADFGILPVCFDSGGWANCLAEGRPDYFGDVRTRRAMTMCMDRQAVVDTVMFGQSIVLDSYLPPQHPLFNADVTTYPFDTAAGGALLEEAGWTLDGSEDGIRIYAGDDPNIPTGTRLSVNYWTTNATQRQQATQVLAASMAECGIEALLEYWTSGEYFADGPDGPLFGRRFDIGQFAWLTGVAPPCDLWLTEGIPGEDAEIYPYAWGGWNDAGYSSAEYDAACKAALASLPGQSGYDENHLLAQEIFATDLPIAPLYLRLKLAGTRPDMCNFVMDPTENSDFWNIEEFDYGDSCG